MKKNFLAIAATALLLVSCANGNNATETKKENRIKQLSWILGSWYINTPEAVISESWEQAGEDMFTGNSLVRGTGGDTLFTERLKLVWENDTLWYIPAVSNQNNGKEVRFKEKSISDKEAIFENLQHDFPQRIVYQKTSDTTILAYIEGMQDGKMRKEEFPYSKKQ